MKYINKYLRNLAPYKVASHKVWEVDEQERRKLLKLDWNEATVPPSPIVQEALVELVKNDELFYLYPSTHNEEIIRLLSEYVQLPKENVQYFASSDSLHEYLVTMYVSVGDPILILGPTYDNFRLTCEAQGGKVYYHEFESGFILNEEAFIKKVEELTPSLIYLCNPNNPSGNLLNKEFILNVLEKFPDTLVIVDEAYFEFSKYTMADYVLRYDNLFISRTFSKAFALANFRAGYLLSDTKNIQQISKIRNPKNFTTFAQVAVTAVLQDIQYMQHYVDEVLQAKEIFKVTLEKLGFIKKVYDSHGNFLLIEFEDFDKKMQVFDTLGNQGVFVRNLIHSHLLINCLRITIGTRVQMDRVARIFEEVDNS